MSVADEYEFLESLKASSLPPTKRLPIPVYMSTSRSIVQLFFTGVENLVAAYADERDSKIELSIEPVYAWALCEEEINGRLMTVVYAMVAHSSGMLVFADLHDNFVQLVTSAEELDTLLTEYET